MELSAELRSKKPRRGLVDRLSCEMREMVMGVCADMGVKLYARFRSEREDWVQAMVMANIGFAFMPGFSVTHPDSVRRPLIEPEVKRTISLITVPGRKHSPSRGRLHPRYPVTQVEIDTPVPVRRFAQQQF
jgi:DNA-binding transcriptional LysR family regulator